VVSIPAVRIGSMDLPIKLFFESAKLNHDKVAITKIEDEIYTPTVADSMEVS
jgi:hypothetical protein